ncbi:MAG TPA: acyl carrier protein [Hyalangium sp.]|jgi:acyl carrier protein|nr:acyl carrier protein [Hyalangium sp.]
MSTAQSLPPPSGAPDAAVVKEWLVGYIAQLLELDRSEVRTNVSMNRYGLDSMSAVSLTGDLGAWLDREVDPRLLYKQKTIDSLADYVAQNHATMPPRRKK